MRGFRFISLLSFSIATFVPLTSAHAVIIPSGVTATSSIDANRDIKHVIDGSGMTMVGDVST